MRIARTIVALLIAVSITTLPARGTAAFDQNSHEPSISMSEPAGTHDCCPDPAVPCGMDGCKMTSFCHSTSFNLSLAVFSELVFPLKALGVELLLGSKVLHSRTGSPPLHPPQV